MLSAVEMWLSSVIIPLYFIVIITEVLLSNWQNKNLYSFKETFKNVYLTMLNAGLDILLRSAFYITVLLSCYSYAFWSIENVYLYWILLFLLEDLMIYIEHYMDHHSRIFWAVHVTHHSSEEFNLSTGFRSSVFQPVYRFIYFIPLTLIGFHPFDIVLIYSLTQTYGILLHTQYIRRMPQWFEAIFVSPSHHRVHHGSNLIYLDKNMGMCLIIWDKLFGTFEPEVEKPVYGLVSNINTYNPIKIAFIEWYNMFKDVFNSKTSFGKRLLYFFKPPGWKHDGSGKLSSDLRQEWENKKLR